MAYIRVSLFTPRAGARVKAERLLQSLAEFHGSLPGHWVTFRVESRGEEPSIGRITAWNDEAAANAAAQAPHDQALRSQLQHLVEEGSSVERSYFGELAAGDAHAS
jgi:quinol monooxygenase YgiN